MRATGARVDDFVVTLRLVVPGAASAPRSRTDVVVWTMPAAAVALGAFAWFVAR